MAERITQSNSRYNKNSPALSKPHKRTNSRHSGNPIPDEDVGKRLYEMIKVIFSTKILGSSIKVTAIAERLISG